MYVHNLPLCQWLACTMQTLYLSHENLKMSQLEKMSHVEPENVLSEGFTALCKSWLHLPKKGNNRFAFCLHLFLHCKFFYADFTFFTNNWHFQFSFQIETFSRFHEAFIRFALVYTLRYMIIWINPVHLLIKRVNKIE